MQQPIPWISDTNNALLHAQFEKSQTKRTTFLWKKSTPTHESPFNFKNWLGKSDEFEKLVGEKWLTFQKWLNFFPTKIFPYFFFPDKVFSLNISYRVKQICNWILIALKDQCFKNLYSCRFSELYCPGNIMIYVWRQLLQTHLGSAISPLSLQRFSPTCFIFWHWKAFIN